MREAHVTFSDSEFEAMGIEKLVSLCREAGLSEFTELVCHGDGAVVQVNVETPLEKDMLSSLECVTGWEYVAKSGDTWVYVIAFTAPELPECIADRMDDLVGTCDPVVSDRGATLSFVGTHDAISGTVSEYEAAGVSLDLQKLSTYEGSARPIDQLTDRQRQVIQTAYDMGYYEVPRAVTTADIAAKLDIDPSTVAEHLQRAERNLLSYHLRT
ncbi:helix-turn-helix domain-containing protein [Haladaptatus sp. NG-SE-30]